MDVDEATRVGPQKVERPSVGLNWSRERLMQSVAGWLDEMSVSGAMAKSDRDARPR